MSGLLGPKIVGPRRLNCALLAGRFAEDRLRRLFALLVKYATRDGQAASEKDSHPGAPDIADHPEAEA